MHQENLNKIVKIYFTLQLLTKLYHWNTTSYSRHKATDDFLGSFTDKIDRFTEVYIGRYKVKPNVSDIKLETNFINDDGIVQLFEQFREFLNDLNNYGLGSDLLNIRDEILADINQALYLFRLK
jgi:DNA-binding ferritin-like protein